MREEMREAMSDDAHEVMDRIPPAWAIGAVVAPGLTIFVLPMLQLIAQNEEFLGGDYGAGTKIFLAGVALAAVGAILWLVRRERVGRRLFLGYLLLTPAWIVYSLVGDGARLAAGVAVLLATIAGAIVLGRRPRRFAMGNLAMISTIAALALTFSTTLEVANAGSTSASAAIPTADQAAEEPLPNVYHVVLDMFQTELFEHQLDDDLRQRLGGFTLYEDNRTEFGRTHMSMASLYAARNWDGDDANAWMFDSFHGEDSALTQLEDAGYHTMGWIDTVLAYAAESPFDSFHVSAQLQNPVETQSARLAETLWLYGNLPPELSERLLEPEEFSMLEDNSLQPDSAPAAASPTMAEIVAAEEDLATTNRYTLIHLMVPHEPYVVDADCELRREEGTDIVAQSACAVQLIEQLLDELERLDRFDDATIVIHGDHGASVDLVDGEVVKVGNDRESLEWNDARSRSLLLVKPSGVANTGSLAVSERPTMVTDVMPTIFDSVGLSIDGPSDRASVLGNHFPERAVRFFNFYSSRDGSPSGPIRRYAITADEFLLDEVIDP